MMKASLSKAVFVRCLTCFVTFGITLMVIPTPPQHARAENETPSPANIRTNSVRIIAEPKSSRPFEWRRGQKVTVGVRVTSENVTRVIGVATHIELVATKTYGNRVEMMLRAEPNAINQILQAAKISEYWFEVMPFDERHVELLEQDIKVDEFLKQHQEYRPATEKDWGYGDSDGRLIPPTNSELPNRHVES